MMNNTIPPEMLEAATVRYMLDKGYSEQAVKMHRQDNDAAWQDAQRHTRLMLEAAGVGEMLAALQQMELVQASYEVAKTELAAAYTLLDEYRQANDHLHALKTSLVARIAELERELANSPEGRE